MERREFLEKLGLGAAFVLTASCLGSCTADSGSMPTPTTDTFTVDLNSSEAANLKTNGGFIIKNRVVIARRVDNGEYVAATIVCSHEGTEKVFYQKSANEFQCTTHGARFSLTGQGLNTNGARGLKIYTTSLNTDKTILTITA